MPNWPLLSFVLLFTFLAGALIYAGILAERRRVDALQSIAPALGFSFEPGSFKADELPIDPAILSLPLFGRGRSRRIRNLMRGRSGGSEQLLFDYRYTISSGKSSHTVEQTVLATCWRGANVPMFQMHPEDVFSRIGQYFGAADIDFESSPEFSGKYVLKGPEPNAVRAYFERQAVTFFSSAPGWSVEGTSEWIVVYRARKREKPDGLSSFLEDARQATRAVAPRESRLG